MEEAFRALLTGHAALTAIVPASRINFAKHPQGADLPYIVLYVISDGAYDYSLDGAGLRDARIQVDAYAITYAQAKAIQRVLTTLLDAYGGGSFQMIALLVSSDRTEDATVDSPVHRAMMDFRAVYTA